MHDVRPFYQRSLFVVLIIGLVFVFTLVSHIPFLKPLQQAIVTITLPVQNVFSWTAFELREWGDLWGSIQGLKEENESLHQELLLLQASQARSVYLEEENTSLRRELNLPENFDHKLVAAEVVARDQTGSASLLRINRGKQQGVKEGMPVVVQGNILIGRVEVAAPFSSEVRLLSHPESLVAVRIEGVKTEAVVRGDHGTGLLLDLARPNEKIEKGAGVITAGTNEGLLGGLFIGTVEAVQLSGDQLFQQAVIIPPVRADLLRFVSVIIE